MKRGVEVIVLLKKIKEIPISIADKIMGLWDLTNVIKDRVNNTSSFDPDNKYFIFIRPDRLYTKRESNGKQTTGYWHVDGHRPEVTLLSHVKGISPENWRIEATENELILYSLTK